MADKEAAQLSFVFRGCSEVVQQGSDSVEHVLDSQVSHHRALRAFLKWPSKVFDVAL